MSQPSDDMTVLIRRLVNKDAIKDLSQEDLRFLSVQLERGSLTKTLVRVFNTEINIQLRKVNGGSLSAKPELVYIPLSNGYFKKRK